MGHLTPRIQARGLRVHQGQHFPSAPAGVASDRRISLQPVRRSASQNSPTRPGHQAHVFSLDGADLAPTRSRGKVRLDYFLPRLPVPSPSSSRPAIYAIHTITAWRTVAVTDSPTLGGQGDVATTARPRAQAHGQQTRTAAARTNHTPFDADTGLPYTVYRYLDAKRDFYLSRIPWAWPRDLICTVWPSDAAPFCRPLGISEVPVNRT